MEKIFKNTVTRTILALMCCALWGSAFPCIKTGYEWLQIEGAGSQILFAGYRFTLAGIFTYFFVCMSEKRFALPEKKNLPMFMGQGVLQTTIQYVFFYVGLAHTTGAKGSVINGSSAFFSIIMAQFLMKNEKITWKKILGCIIGFAGVLVVNLTTGADGGFSLFSEGGFSFLGEGMILLCAVAYGTSSVTLKRISHRDTPAAITAYQLMFGGALMIAIGFILGGNVTGFDLASGVLLIYMALLSTVAFSIWAALLKYNAVGQIAIFGFSIPIFGSVLSGIFLGEEILTWQNLLALILVSVGIFIVNLPGKISEKM